ncbi:MAG: redoxin domain-containing protein [Planctomycetota bacterium]
MTVTLTPRRAPLSIGDEAPDFTLSNDAREDWSLSKALDEGRVVLCFFPFAFTSVCTDEMQCVTNDLDKWSNGGVSVVGVSCDSFAALAAWRERLGLKQTLLSDIKRDVCRAYGLFWDDLNVSKRGTVVIGKDASGAARVEWIQAREPGNAMDFDAVLAAAKA